MEGLIVFIVIFVIGAIADALAKKGRPAGAPPPPPGQGPPRPVLLPNGDLQLPSGEIIRARRIPDAAPAPAPAPARQPDPFAGWGVWPGEESSSEPTDLAVYDAEEAIPEEETVVSLEPVGSTGWDAGMRAHTADTVPEPKPLETEVDWTQEHERFHERYFSGAGTSGVTSRPSATLRQLRDRGTLRQAVLMAEILGPPRATRAFEEK
jgi:hypothetical protein